MINIEELKNKILLVINSSGPSLPLHISRAIGLSPLFSSAILSELVNERRLNLSNLKVGSSPLYFIPGQEQKLENFAENLTGIEKSTFLKLKHEKVLYDEKQEPAIRVALRSLKDFSIPLKFREKLIWKYTFASNEEIQEILSPKTFQKTNQESHLRIEKVSDKKEIPFSKIKPKKTKQTSSQKAEKFLQEVKEYLLAKDIELLREIQSDKKGLLAKIRINSDLGKIILLLIAKDKKRVSEADLTMAYQKAIHEKMPCLFLSHGEPSKKTQEFIETYKNLIKIGKMPQ